MLDNPNANGLDPSGASRYGHYVYIRGNQSASAIVMSRTSADRSCTPLNG